MEFKPQTRFLLRGSALLIGLLTLWWFVLLAPMLYLLKGATGLFLSVEENSTNGWTLRVPLEQTLPPTPQQPVPRQIRSVDFDIPRSDVVTFTFSLPVYWAIILAAPGVTRSLRPLLLGTMVLSATEIALLLGFAQLTAFGAASQMTGNGQAIGLWFRQVGVYLVVNVIPYMAPFAVALWLHQQLRSEVLSVDARS
jgi:hypothetical protein